MPRDLAVAVRAWAKADYLEEAKRHARADKRFRDLGPSAWALVFDTETTIDPGQSLRVGCYQLRRRGRLRQAGLFYEPSAVTEAELETLRSYAVHAGFELLLDVGLLLLVLLWAARMLVERRLTVARCSLMP